VTADAFLFDALAESDETTPLDIALARTVARADPERGRTLALTAALVSVARRRGDSAVRLADWAGRAFPGTATPLPDADVWAEALRASPTVQTDAAGDLRPLALDASGRVQFARDQTSEAGLAATLAALAARPTPVAEPAGLAESFALLFPEADANDRQAVAAAGALRHRLAVVAGGPGTGKTTTVVRMLALLLTARPGLRIALAAPTGKAANRLASSVAAGAERLPEALAGVPLPQTATTLHRLLDYSPTRRSVGRDAGRPVPADVVVVDEASMVDLGMFAALAAALRPDARLILLGDRDQLPSVDAGSVFADVCDAADALVAHESGTAAVDGFSAFCAVLGLAGVPEPATPLGAAVVRLERTYRYPPGSGLGALAGALRSGDAAAVAAALDSAPDIRVVPAATAGAGDAIWPHVREAAQALVEAPDAAEALRRAAAFRLLAPTRGGPRGVYALNRLVEARLVAEGFASPGAWMHGRPILVTRNDHDRALYNGDVGVVWAPGGAAPVVVFEGEAGGRLREIPVGALPEHETAWATTVHKSQGSEFDRVVVVLPAEGTPQAERLTRELAYTAVTRARGATAEVPVPLVVVGSADLLAAAAGRRETRTSAFLDALRAAG
jgi:exodeoxyribonuclease V alpha subunit